MKRAARDWAWHGRGLTPAQRLVLLALAEHAEETCGCWPSFPSALRKRRCIVPADGFDDLLGPCPDARLAFHPVTRAVGNMRNEGPELIAAIADESPRAG
jgi:putative SOS response-associated peptidase YedK